MAKEIGFVIDRGLSPLDGRPYVAIMTLKSSNRKTGDMCQVFIIKPDIHPSQAILTGEDYSICGSCTHRSRWVEELRKFVRTCYVDVPKSVASVYRAFLRGRYPDITHADAVRYVTGRKIRWGAYGDPSIINPATVVGLNILADGHTGYTHQWRQPWAEWCRGIFQASCDSFADYLQASAHGWKTFAVVAQGATPFSGKLCPATAENSQAQCKTCSLCDGGKTDIFVEAHGRGAKHVVNV